MKSAYNLRGQPICYDLWVESCEFVEVISFSRKKCDLRKHQAAYHIHRQTMVHFGSKMCYILLFSENWDDENQHEPMQWFKDICINRPTENGVFGQNTFSDFKTQISVGLMHQFFKKRFCIVPMCLQIRDVVFD